MHLDQQGARLGQVVAEKHQIIVVAGDRQAQRCVPSVADYAHEAPH